MSSILDVLPRWNLNLQNCFCRPKVIRQAPPLNDLEFVIVGKLEADKDEFKTKIVKNGGKVTSKISSKTFAVISNEGIIFWKCYIICGTPFQQV